MLALVSSSLFDSPGIFPLTYNQQDESQYFQEGYYIIYVHVYKYAHIYAIAGSTDTYFASTKNPFFLVRMDKRWLGMQHSCQYI